MSATIKTTVYIDQRAIENKLTKLLKDERVMLEIHNEFARMCNPYVPFLEGPLSQTIEVTPWWVKYTQPYAHYQYTGDGFNFTKDYHPLATAYWDKAMMRDHGEEFTATVNQILQRRAKEIYG